MVLADRSWGVLPSAWGSWSARTKGQPRAGGGVLIRGGGPLARAPPRCGCASTPIHSLSVLAESWLPTHTRVSFATEGDSLGEQERAWELQGAGQEEPQEERRGPETAGEASSFRASPAPNRWEWDTRGGGGATAGWVRKPQIGKCGPKWRP